MNSEINILELFSGIGGFTKGFQAAGYSIKNHYFSEVDKHAIANYKYNFKNAIYVGSVTTLRGRDIERPHIITFGSPCQDFSLAGNRAGMEGQRSSLIKEAIRLVDECRPDIFIWENVKGTFSSNAGADFWAIIQAFTNIGAYRIEWQLLNTAWFLPQNRERIYLVGHLAESSEPRVFPFCENDFISKRTATAKEVKSQTQNSSTIGTKQGNRATDTFIKTPKTAKTLTGGGHSGGLHSDMTTIQVGTLRTHNDGNGFRKIQSNNAPTLPARARKDGSGQAVVKVQSVIDANRKNKFQNGRTLKNEDEPSYTIDCQGQNGVLLNDESLRRLTEIESERLQGFPDDWTKYGIYERQVWINKKEKTFKIVEYVYEIPKTQRFKLLGNAVTVDVVEEIANRLI
jgi:DNA (cytosine-5)-methyltransferase 1